jgi:hypothetical protein
MSVGDKRYVADIDQSLSSVVFKIIISILARLNNRLSRKDKNYIQNFNKKKWYRPLESGGDRFLQKGKSYSRHAGG